MTTLDFIEARYGDWIFGDVGASEAMEMEARQRRLWPILAELTGTTAAAPRMRCVHSPRALPAFMGSTAEGSELIWDAGLGTLFNHLAFPLSYTQPAAVVEAVVHQLVAVRLLIAGHADRASAHAARVESLLDETPIDRFYQQSVDAEDQFDVYLLTEVQEEFILAHELAHHLRSVDPVAFTRFERVALRAAFDAERSADGLLYRGERDHFGLSDGGLNPYAWYLRDLVDGDDPPMIASTYKEDLTVARDCFRAQAGAMREEILCDLLGAATVAVVADRREQGWSVATSVANSRAALINMRLVKTIDSWILGSSASPGEVLGQNGDREKCLLGLLPGLLGILLREKHTQVVPLEADLHAVMRCAEAVVVRQLSPGFDALAYLRPVSDAEVKAAGEILLFAGFVPTRPSADNRLTNRIANHFLFEKGALRRSARVEQRELGNPTFVRTIDDLLLRHQRGDWSELYEEDAEANMRALFEEFMPPTPERLRGRGTIWSFFRVDAETVVLRTPPDRSLTEVCFIAEM